MGISKERNEKVTGLISELIEAFPETQESIFVILAKKLIELNYSDDTIKRMVSKTILNVNKSRISVADVINSATMSPNEFMRDGRRCFGDRNDPTFIDEDNPIPNYYDFHGDLKAYQKALYEYQRKQENSND